MSCLRSTARWIAFASVLFALSPQLHAQNYHVVSRWTIGGEGGWDYLHMDAPAHRLYIAHGSQVDVVNTETGKRVGAVTGLKGTHGVVLDPDGRTGYISDGGANAIVVFDRHSLAVLGSIPAGSNPDGIVYEPTTKTVWAFNGRSSSATVADGKTRKVVATITLPGRPEFPVADGKGHVFANIEDKSEIAEMDARTHAVLAVWPLAPGESPSGLAIDAAGDRLFSVCHNGKMVVMDSRNGKVLATPSIGTGPDAARYDAKHKLAFSSNGGDGTLTIVDAGKPGYPVLQTVTTEKGARTMALDSVTGRIYLATAKFGPPPTGAAAGQRWRRSIVPGSFTILVVGR
jgi:YVTN family beta-propeller protein